jgi:hypothetical protein
MQSLASQMPQMPKRGGMFGGDGKFGVGQAIVAALNGYLASQGNPVGIANIRMMQEAAQAKRDSAEYDRRRQQALQDQMSMYDYKLAHPEQTAPHYFESNSGDQYAIGADGKPQEVFHDPLRYKLVPNGMGGVVPVSIEALMGGPPQGAPAIGTVMADPRKQGGAGQAAPRPFPY